MKSKEICKYKPKNITAMKLLKTLMFSTLLFTCTLNASAYNENNLIYNSEEENGMMVGQTV